MSFNFDGMIYTRPYKAEMAKRPSENVVFCPYFDRDMSAGFCSFSESCLCANHLAQVQKKMFPLLSPPPLPFPPFLQKSENMKNMKMKKWKNK